MQELLKADEVIKKFKLSRKYLYTAVERGIMPVYRFGRALRFDPEEVREWAKRMHERRGNHE